MSAILNALQTKDAIPLSLQRKLTALIFHKHFFLFQNPGICTTLPEEIKLFYELSSIDMEEFNVSLDQLKDEIASRMSLCQLSSIEEFNVCMTYSLGEFKLNQLRFDKLSLAGDCQGSTSEEDKIENKNMTLKRKREENGKNEGNELEIKSNAKRMRSCEPENSNGTPAAIKRKIVLESSCNDTFPYDYDPSEGCIIGKSISREDFMSKHKYITAWAECQSETCLNRNSANSASSFSGEDMDLDEISLQRKFSDDVSETKLCSSPASQLSSHDPNVSADLSHLTSAQNQSAQPSTHLEQPSNQVYTDCLKSHISDRVEQPTQPMNSEINQDFINTQNEHKNKADSELKCCDKMISKTKINRVDMNNVAKVTQGCNKKPKIEAWRALNETLSGIESNKVSSEANSNVPLKTAKLKSTTSLNLELKCYDKVSSVSSGRKMIESDNKKQVTQGCNEEPKKEACRTSTECLPEVTNKLSGDTHSNKCLKTFKQGSESNLNLQLKCYKKVSLQSNSENKVGSQNTARDIRGCIGKPNVKACQMSYEILPDGNNIKLPGEPELRQSLKITLVHKGCGIWAVKTSNKRKRSESESDNCIDKINGSKAMTDAQAILEESAKVLKRVKLALTNDGPSKKVKQGPVHTTKFKSLRRLATNLCEMKSRIFRKPFQKKRATVTPLLI